MARFPKVTDMQDLKCPYRGWPGKRDVTAGACIECIAYLAGKTPNLYKHNNENNLIYTCSLGRMFHNFLYTWQLKLCVLKLAR